MASQKKPEKSGDPEKTQKKRGRKPDTAEQKAAKKAAKAAEKAAAKKSEGEQRQKAAIAAAGSNSADPKLRELFIGNYLPKVSKLRERSKSVNGELRALYKEAQRDGFTKEQFDTAILCGTPEGEAKVQAKMVATLQAAQFVGAMLGKQLDLFNEPDRTPLADRAFDEGKQASMENKAALPPYAPDTEAYRRYMEGYQGHQTELLNKGIKAKAPPLAPPASEVSNVVPMTAGPAADDGTGAENDNAEDDEEFADREAAS